MSRAILSFILLAALVGCGGEPTAPAGAGIAVSVRVASVDVSASSARVVWEVRPVLVGQLLVQRRLAGAPWKGLARVALDADGRLLLEDRSVQPGAHYTYRVQVSDGEVPSYAGELSVEVPEP